MLKKTVCIGILLVLVGSFMVFPVSAKPAHAVSVDRDVQVRFFDSQWDGDTSGDDYSSPDAVLGDWTKDPTTTIGQMRAIFEEFTGYPVLILALVNDDGGCGFETDFVIPTNDSVPISNYEICKDEPLNLSIFLVYRADSNVAATRLTLFGYVNDNSKSCVLWSLDGSRPINVDSKCGGGSELVCTVKLVGKELEYDCQGDYDWLGQQIVNDSKWLEWAHKFASKNGK